MTRALRNALAATSIAVALLGSAACSSDNESSGDSSDGTATSDPNTTATDNSTVEVIEDEAADPNLPDACALVTLTQLEDATGVEFADGVVNEFVDVSSESICDYSSVEGLELVQILVSSAAPDAIERRASAEIELSTTSNAEVPGANDAYIVNGLGQIGMGANNVFLQIAITGDDIGTNAQLIAIATDAVASL